MAKIDTLNAIEIDRQIIFVRTLMDTLSLAQMAHLESREVEREYLFNIANAMLLAVREPLRKAIGLD